jgi:putative exosortase-associated protein (TIGR04073 family)
MKKIMAVLVVLVAFSFEGLVAGAYAEGIKTGFSLQCSTDKLMRGVANLADSLVEVPGTMMRKSNKEGVLSGMTFGMVEGVFNTVKRAMAGAWEIVTFPIPVPENYDPILPEPEFLNVN